PMPSKIWSISTDVKRAVPLNSRCSRKCETPAWAGVSLRDPVRIQGPSAIERIDGIASVTTRMPESSSVSWWPSPVVTATGTLPAIPGVLGGAGTAIAAVAPVPVTAAAAPAAVATATALVAGADRRELLGRLTLDVGVVRQAQADPAALAVDLDHAHVHLV